MFNYVNGNPFGQKIESAVSTGGDRQQKKKEQKDEEEKKYLEEDDNDEVSIKSLPELSEDDVKFLVKDYIGRLKSEHEGENKVLQKLDKYLVKFDVKRFIKSNPHMTASDFHMVMFNETMDLVK